MQPPSSHYRKRLGQHFLNNQPVARRIVGFAQVENEVVLEIGAGKGILTKILAHKAKRVFAVEIDKELANVLSRLSLPNVSVINEDFLKINLQDFAQTVIIGNIPYAITTPILERLVMQRNYFARAVFTIQKEYGARLLAEVGCRQYGAITIFLNYYFLIKKGFNIPAKYFSPRPKVNSVVISLTTRKPPFTIKDEESFFQFIRGVFRYRRKVLKNALINYLDILPEGIETSLLQKRPENLSLEDFHHLFESFKPL